MLPKLGPSPIRDFNSSKIFLIVFVWKVMCSSILGSRGLGGGVPESVCVSVWEGRRKGLVS